MCRPGVSVEYVQAKAEATGSTRFPFDLISAGTCWFWFDGDLAAAEAMRVLKPGGHLMIAMLALVAVEEQRGRRVRAADREAQSDLEARQLRSGVRYMRDLANGGFEKREMFAVEYGHPL